MMVEWHGPVKPEKTFDNDSGRTIAFMHPLSEQVITNLLNWLGDQEEFIFLDCARANGEEYHSYLFLEPVRWLVCTEKDGAVQFLVEADELRQAGYHLAGWIGYEFGYLLETSLRHLCPDTPPYAVLGVFGEPLVVDHRSGDAPPALEALLQDAGDGPSESFAVRDFRTNIAREKYLQAIARIKDYIVAGDTYQVNYTLKLMFHFSGFPSALYGALRRSQAVSYGAWIRQGGREIMSFSPELFFRADRDGITVRPMKGTIRRGRTLAEDARQREILAADIKNRSENVMIVDLLRNDLGRLLHATGGGFVQPRSLFDVEVYETVQQMTSTINGIPRQRNVPSLQETLPAIFPCGSVTGAPKIRTMEIIRELEVEPRGVYCGAIGFSSAGETVFNVPIRTVVLDGERGEMGIGSGIVYDSDPEAEWQESLLKGKFLTLPQPEFQLIETLLWLPGKEYWLLDQHLERLSGSAAYFLFACDRSAVENLLRQAAEQFAAPMRVRLLLHRDGSVDISATKLDPDFQPVEGTGGTAASPLQKVTFSPLPTNPDDIHLYHKTTQRQLYSEEREKALAGGFVEVLFVNTSGEVTEGSISNIFIRKDGRLLTPPIECGLLAGTFRKYLVDRGMVSEAVVTMDDIRQAEEVYIGNSVRGLVQVAVTGP